MLESNVSILKVFVSSTAYPYYLPVFPRFATLVPCVYRSDGWTLQVKVARPQLVINSTSKDALELFYGQSKKDPRLVY